MSRRVVILVVVGFTLLAGLSASKLSRWVRAALAKPASSSLSSSAVLDHQSPATPQTIAGTRGVATRQAVVNLSELAERERSGHSRSSESVIIPDVIPGPDNLPVPSSALASSEKLNSAPVVSAAASPAKPAIPSPTPSSIFLALSDDGTRFPPDTAAAVGPDHLMVMADSQIRILDTNGNAILTLSTAGFWQPLNSNLIGQPRVVYDSANDRFIATVLADPRTDNAALLLGVSQTDDPTGNWTLSRIDVDSQNQVSPDFPSLGFNNKWIVVTANMFNIAAPNNFNRAQVYAFDKTRLYAGSTSFTVFQDTTGGSTLAPARTYDETQANMYLVGNWNGNSNGKGFLRIGEIIGAVGSEQYIPNLFFPSVSNTWASAPPGNQDFAPQLGSDKKINVGDSRIHSVSYINGSLWCANTAFVPADAALRCAVQFFQLDPANGAILQDGRLDDPTQTDFFAYPNIEVNKKGDVGFSYNRFSATQYPSANYSFHAADDPINMLRADTVFKAGEAPYYRPTSSGRNAWGNYNAIALDPDGLSFWAFNESAAPLRDGNSAWRITGVSILSPAISDHLATELKDDNGMPGSNFTLPGGATACRLKRFASTPGSQVTIAGVETYFDTSSGANPGDQITILSGQIPRETPKGFLLIDSATLQKTLTTIGALNQYVNHPITPFTVQPGYDVVVGNMGKTFQFDTSPSQGDSYYANDCQNFTLTDNLGDSNNWLIRAQGTTSPICSARLNRHKSNYDAALGHSKRLTGKRNPRTCLPTATAGAPWITNLNVVPNSNSSTFRVTYDVAPNNSPIARTTTINVGGDTCTISQAGNNLLPSIGNPAPGLIPSGGQGLTFTINASGGGFSNNLRASVAAPGFTANSIVGWNGEDRPTTLVSSTQLTAQISADDIATAGTARVSVFDVSAGGGTSPAVTFTISNNPLAAAVSAANYQPALATESIAAAFGSGFATTALAAMTTPLPTVLGGTTLRVKDRVGIERLAPLFYVSPNQVNFQIPPGAAYGDALATIVSGDGTTSSRLIQIANVAPALFSANASGQGVAAAVVLRVKADSSQIFEQIVQFDPAQNKFVSTPIDLGPPTDQIFLIAFGTGIRQRSELTAVAAKMGGVDASVFFAGAQGGFVGLDQVNVLVPRSLAGRGEVDVVLTVDGQTANAVRLNIK